MEKWTHGLQSWNLVIFRIEPSIKRSIVFLYPSHFRKIYEKEPRYNETMLSEHILPPLALVLPSTKLKDLKIHQR